MSFLIENVKLENFRNYDSFELSSIGVINILIGNNASGKTNLIEAIQLLSSGSSFRRPPVKEIIKTGCLKAKISMLVKDRSENRENFIQVVFDDEGKRFLINDNKKSSQKLSDLLNYVLFVPDDLRIIKGAAERRRDVLDDVGMQLSSTYLNIKKDYEKIIKQRNSLLKDEFVPHNLIEVWTDSLIEIGTIFYIHRRKLFSRIEELFYKNYQLLVNDEEIDINYVPSWNSHVTDNGILKKSYSLNDKEEIKGLFQSALDIVAVEEKRRKISLIGPHRDEIEFKINGKDARRFGSQGQQRTLVLAWKLTEVEAIQEISGNTPILLLDDVMSELDTNRRESLIEFIEARHIQTFITTTHFNYFSPNFLESATIVKL